MILKIFKKLFQRKLITGIILILIIIGGYFGYRTLTGGKNNVRYVMAAVEKGTLIVSVSGSGQVSVSNQIEIKSKISGDVVYVGVEKGQEVKNRQLIVKIDDSDAQKAVRDAEINLETAQISLNQAKEDQEQTKEDSESELQKTYEDGFNEITGAFVDFPVIMPGLQEILFDDAISPPSWNVDIYEYYTGYKVSYESDIYYKSYHTAKSSYEKSLADYESSSRFSDRDTIKSLIDETYQTTKNIAEAIKNTNDLVQSYKRALTDRNMPVSSTADTYISNLNSYTSKVNSHLATLLSLKNTIEAGVDSDSYDIRSKELSVEQKESALSDAKEKLAEYSVYASFGGVIATMDTEKGDSVSAGTVLASIITQQKIAEITLNEVDAAKVKIGQKATLTFDALPELSISGKVIEIDTLGTVTQGVVSYGVKLVFDTQDENIKPGMSVTADIVTDIKQDVLVVPNNAIKSQGNSKYIELVENSGDTKQQLLSNNNSGITLSALPKQQSVETGLSDDSYTEIVSGLKEGDIIVTSTINPGQTQASNRSQNSFQIPGVTGGSGQGGIQGGRFPD